MDEKVGISRFPGESTPAAWQRHQAAGETSDRKFCLWHSGWVGEDTEHGEAGPSCHLDPMAPPWWPLVRDPAPQTFGSTNLADWRPITPEEEAELTKGAAPEPVCDHKWLLLTWDSQNPWHRAWCPDCDETRRR